MKEAESLNKRVHNHIISKHSYVCTKLNIPKLNSKNQHKISSPDRNKLPFAILKHRDPLMIHDDRSECQTKRRRQLVSVIELNGRRTGKPREDSLSFKEGWEKKMMGVASYSVQFHKVWLTPNDWLVKSERICGGCRRNCSGRG